MIVGFGSLEPVQHKVMRNSSKLLAALQPAPTLDTTTYLRDGERIVSQFGPYFATSQRILVVLKKAAGTDVDELPYAQLESIDEVSVPNHRKMIMGSILAILGLILTFGWFLILPMIAVFAGVILVFHGAVGQPAYYQLRGRDMEREQLRRWQVRRYGAGSFIATIRTITGLEADAPFPGR
ncbi:MAG: hypothetical protein QF898_09615 [SAR202 cluster bacterium]|nr:hypothetical protein [SAR202 cluster bacterium]MDP6713795.1 hypothetical protein [SAR202 cluster bacterium]